MRRTYGRYPEFHCNAHRPSGVWTPWRFKLVAYDCRFLRSLYSIGR